MEFSFGRTAGLEGAKAFLKQALAGNRFPHALLVHGPEGAGQNALLLDVADILSCSSVETKPCGRCPGCRGRRAGSLDTILYILPIEKKSSDGEIENAIEELSAKAQELESDPYGFTRAEKARIQIAQVREMQSRLAYAEGSKRARVILILSAEAMPHEAANALLKILEEPPADTYFLLASEDKAALLPTILSRCTCLTAPPMDAAALASAVAAKKDWWGDAPPLRLLPFAEGSLGALLRLHRNAGEALLEEAGRFLAAALGGRWDAFAAYLSGSSHWGDMENASRLLQFLLRVVRVFHRLETLEGPPAGGAWLSNALRSQGWDPSLAESLSSLQSIRDLTPLVAFLESALSAIQGYAKPDVALLGRYLEFEATASTAADASTAAARHVPARTR
jgi:DNA polymerase-3 subunit delta'